MSRHTAAPPDIANTRLLTLDASNMFQSAVGTQGLDPASVEMLEPRLARAHATVAELSRGGLDAEFACLNLGREMPAHLDAVLAEADKLKQFRNIVLIGIGGSSLGTKAIRHALKPEAEHPDGPHLYFVENVDPPHLTLLLSRLAPAETALLCISKSGGTIETVVQYLVLRDWLEHALGQDRARQQQWFVTDPDQGWLRDLAGRDGVATLPVPPRVGGRYSVLTAVGLLPLAAVGVDIKQLLRGAADNAARCAGGDIPGNPALELAAIHYLLDRQRHKRIAVMMPYVNRLRLFVDWYCQLWAESLGKWAGPPSGTEPAGTLPVRAMGAVDQHSQLQMYLESRHDKMFTFIELTHWDEDLPIPLRDEDRASFPYLHDTTLVDVIGAEFEATRQVITAAGHPNASLRLPVLDAHVLGQMIDLYQRATVYTALLYEVNPLDQPSVEKGKILAIRALAEQAARRGTGS